MLQTPDQVTLSEREAEVYQVPLRDLLRTMAGAKRALVRNCLITAAVATAVAFLIPVTYTAEAVVLTPQQAPSALSAMAQVSGVGSTSSLSALGWLSGFGLHNPTDLYIGILESRSIADAIVLRFDLKRVYGKKDVYGARKRLMRNTTIKAGKDTLIHISVDDHDAKRAAGMAQAYVDELFRLNSDLALGEASQRRLFFEEQLAKEKDALATAEIGMKNSQQSTGLIAPAGQADALMRSVSQLHVEILSREAQLAAMKTYVADDNPRLQTVQRGIATLRAELARLEQGQHDPGSPEVPAGLLPEAGLQYLRHYRDMKYHETLFEILAKQYEAARLDEAKSAPLIQLIDRPIPPERKSWPPRTVIILASTAAALLCTSLWALVENAPQHARVVPARLNI